MSIRMTIHWCAATACVAGLAMACGGASDSSGPDGPTGGLAACGSVAPMSVSPVPVASIHEIAPLGNLNPPGHTTPTFHIYFYFAASGQVNTTPVPLVAPGNLLIAEVIRQTRTGGGLPDFADYSLTYFPCADLRLFFGHVSTLAPEIASQVGSFDTGCRPAYMTGGFTYQQCVRTTAITVTAGESLGTASGPGQGALDWGGADRRTPALAFVNPAPSDDGGGEFSRNHTICTVDYLAPAVRDALRALFGRGARRVAEPVCGEVMQDVAGTAQGRWFHGASSQDDKNLALVHDNVDPAIGAISTGTAVPSLATRVYRFQPVTDGRVNLDFARVLPDGNIYCYEPDAAPGQLVLLQLVSATRLRVEGRLGSACGIPAGWAFTAGAVEFQR